MPIGSDPNVVTDTNGSITDVTGVGPVPQQVPGTVQSIAQNLATWAATPGNVYAGQQSQTPGMWSDLDEAVAQANIAAQFGWGPETALIMMGAGGAPADASLTMGRPSVEYLNARRAAKPASGGQAYARTAKLAPETETMTPEEMTAAKAESDWAMLNITQEAFWDKLFERMGLTRGYSLDDTFGSGSRKLAPVGATQFTGSLPKHAKEVFSEDGATIHKLQKPGRYPSYVATSPIEGERYQFKDFDEAKRWVAPPKFQRPEPAAPGERPPWE